MAFNLNENVNTLFESLEKFLTSKTVVGEPIHIGEVTLVPIINLAFGVGTGGGDGIDDKGSKGLGAGGGVGAKASPTAIIVIKGDSVEMLPIKSSNGLEKLIDMVPEIVSKVKSKKDEVSKEAD
ncbi:Uncharacterized spore protein YtfJ [Geosporobacter subterraneus DSM 17957]|uniref:Uncharacterized spore protein YtfJ n=1 Tax=Geosporobacter subterraneus DSM 17957 TaxID=1121919 RepID=A0A1M6GLE7_9FIRM|nr:spore germination protein GerW family protein [Geosporobacter subterraneus]SHJ10770.1 Uncharacterized spore protein YtfJ [Geosporobacter subterraneus DSM 17957]